MDDDLQRDLDRIRELLRQLCPEDKERILERCQANEEKAAAIKCLQPPFLAFGNRFAVFANGGKGAGGNRKADQAGQCKCKKFL